MSCENRSSRITYCGSVTEFLLTSLHWLVALSRNVLVKGGHLPGTGGMVDVLYDGTVEF
jgi:hypothetical protein